MELGYHYVALTEFKKLYEEILNCLKKRNEIKYDQKYIS